MGYRGKVDEQNRARDLRAEGWTLGEICEELGVSKASASLWCKDVEIDVKALTERRRARHLSGNEGARARGPNKLQRAKQAEIDDAMAGGLRLIGTLGDRDLLIAGVALYAGEGSKTPGGVKFTNSDARMVRLFLTWLRHFFEVDEHRLRVHLYLHQGLDLEAAIAFWVRVTGIPGKQFTKPYRAVPDPSIRSSKHPMGCVGVAYSCTRTHRRIMGMSAALLSSDVPLPG
jgi:hypothetical protein